MSAYRTFDARVRAAVRAATPSDRLLLLAEDLAVALLSPGRGRFPKGDACEELVWTALCCPGSPAPDGGPAARSECESVTRSKRVCTSGDASSGSTSRSGATPSGRPYGIGAASSGERSAPPEERPWISSAQAARSSMYFGLP